MGLAEIGSASRLAAGFIVRFSKLGDVACHLDVPDSNRGNTVLLPGDVCDRQTGSEAGLPRKTMCVLSHLMISRVGIIWPLWKFWSQMSLLGSGFSQWNILL